MDRLGEFLARLGLTGAGAWAMGHFFGADGVQLVGAYLTVAALDILTGTCAAIKRRELRASKHFEGILKKVCCVAAIAVGHQADVALGAGNLARDGMWLYVFAYELKSNTENLAVLGILVPETVQDLFARVLEAKVEKAPPAPPPGPAPKRRPELDR